MCTSTDARNTGASTGITLPFSLHTSFNSRCTFNMFAICLVFSSLPCTSPLRSSHTVCHDVHERPMIAAVHNCPDNFFSPFDAWRDYFPWRSAHSVHMRPLNICLHPMAFWAQIRSWVMSGCPVDGKSISCRNHRFNPWIRMSCRIDLVFSDSHRSVRSVINLSLHAFLVR